MHEALPRCQLNEDTCQTSGTLRGPVSTTHSVSTHCHFIITTAAVYLTASVSHCYCLTVSAQTNGGEFDALFDIPKMLDVPGDELVPPSDTTTQLISPTAGAALQLR